MENIICFHNPDEENGYLSNWYISEFVWNEKLFTSVEQFMMYRKAVLFHDFERAMMIMATSDVVKIKSLGREITPYEDSVWRESRYDSVLPGIYEKFAQNPELRERLLLTGDTILAECAVKDKIWGIGLSMRDPLRFSPERWKGQNLLGKALMQVRLKLKSESTMYTKGQ